MAYRPQFAPLELRTEPRVCPPLSVEDIMARRPEAANMVAEAVLRMVARNGIPIHAWDCGCPACLKAFA